MGAARWVEADRKWFWKRWRAESFRIATIRVFDVSLVSLTTDIRVDVEKAKIGWWCVIRQRVVE